MTSQDLIKGIDITGLSTVSASELIQLVDVARTSIDKGLTIVTTDSALNVPVVPNPDVILEGVIPLWWKRYIWIRKPFDATGFVYLYAWNDSIASDPTYLKWQSTGADITSLTAQVNTLVGQVATLITNGSSMQAAITLSQAAIISLNQSNATTNTRLLSLEGALNAIWPIGTYRYTSYGETDSSKWLQADGRAISRTTYATLFSLMGIIYGAGDGTTTFNLPDCRSRMPIGASDIHSTPAGLTARFLGTVGGEETHKLLSSESGIPAHTHDTVFGTNTSASGSDNEAFRSGVLNPATKTSNANTAADAVNPHNNMSPFMPCFIMLRIA